MTDLREALEAIRRSKSVAIAGHVNPDGDSIGSLLSLGLGLENLGKKVRMISEDGVPRRYRGLPGAGRIKRALREDVDLAITVDCSSKEILGDTFKVFRKSPVLLEVDHHEFRRPFGTIAVVDREAAAVGEIIYLILKSLNLGITKDIAQNLMTSIIVETNSFRLPNVRPYTFEVCADLIKKNFDFYKLVDTVFWSTRRESAILMGLCLSRCRFMRNGKIAWSMIKQEDFRIVRGTDEDVDPVPDEMRSIKSVLVAVLFREKDSRTIRVSLRSKGRINIAAIAEQYNGGGHYDVAGCTIRNTRHDINKFLTTIGGLV